MKILLFFIFINSLVSKEHPSYKVSFEPYYLLLDDSRQMFVNTYVENNKEVIKVYDSYYFNTRGNLCEMDKYGTLHIYRLPAITKTRHNSISTLAFIEDTLWVGTATSGIWLFDLDKKNFTRQIKLSWDENQRLPRNLKIVHDLKNQILWIPSFKKLDMYSTLEKKWTNLNGIYPALGVGKYPGRQNIKFDGDEVWIISTPGGILNYNYSTNEWKAYFNELIGTDTISYKRFDTQAVWISDDYVWAVTSLGNNSIANLRLSLLNKITREWYYFHPNNFNELVPILNSTENCTKRRITKYLLMRSKKYSFFYKDIINSSYYPDYKKYFVATDSNKIDYSIKVLENLSSKIDTNELCLIQNYSYFIQDNIIMHLNKFNELDSIPFLDHPIKYERILASHNEKLVIGSNYGIIILNLKTRKITKFSHHLKRHQYREMSKPYFYENKIYIIDYNEIGACEDNPEAITHLYEIDLIEDKLITYHSEKFESHDRNELKYSEEIESYYRFDGSVLIKNDEELFINDMIINEFDDQKYFIDREGLKIGH